MFCERALDLSTARLGGPWTNPRPARYRMQFSCPGSNVADSMP